MISVRPVAASGVRMVEMPVAAGRMRPSAAANLVLLLMATACVITATGERNGDDGLPLARRSPT
jgi:hypothetical protein